MKLWEIMEIRHTRMARSFLESEDIADEEVVVLAEVQLMLPKYVSFLESKAIADEEVVVLAEVQLMPKKRGEKK